MMSYIALLPDYTIALPIFRNRSQLKFPAGAHRFHNFAAVSEIRNLNALEALNTKEKGGS